MRNYKKVSDCPPGLQKLFAFLNLLPSDLDSFLSELNVLKTKEGNSEEIEVKFIEYANNLNPELKRLLFNGFGDAATVWQMALNQGNNDKKALKFLIKNENTYGRNEYRRIMKKIAQFTKLQAKTFERLGAISLFSLSDKKRDEYSSQYASLTDDELKTLVDNLVTQEERDKVMFEHRQQNKYSAKLEAILKVNADGYIDLSIGGLGKIVKEERIKFDRVRLCPVCDFLFWAKRQNSETCGRKKCVDTLGNRKRLNKAKEKEKSKQDLREIWKNQDFSVKKDKL